MAGVVVVVVVVYLLSLFRECCCRCSISDLTDLAVLSARYFGIE